MFEVQCQRWFKLITLVGAAWLYFVVHGSGADGRDPLKSGETLDAVVKENRRQNDNAKALYQKGDMEGATNLLVQVLQRTEKALGGDHPEMAINMTALAEIEMEAGNFRAAQSLLERSLTIMEKHLPPGHPDRATCLNNLAVVYRFMGRYRDAQHLYESALRIYEARDKNHPDLATTLGNLGTLYQDLGEFTQAESLMKRSLAVRESVLGGAHPDVATGLNNLAILYQMQGRSAEALAMHQRSLAILEKAYGPTHRNVASSQVNLSHLYLEYGDYEQAVPLLLKGLDTLFKILGPDSPEVASVLVDLAVVYEQQGPEGAEKALPLLRESLSIKMKAFGSDHPETASALNNLGTFYLARGDYSNAAPLLEQSLAITEKHFGAEHPETAMVLHNLAGLYAQTGQFRTAISLFRRSARIRMDLAAGGSPDAFRSVMCLGLACLGRGDISNALPNVASARQNQRLYLVTQLAWLPTKEALHVLAHVANSGYGDILHSLCQIAVTNLSDAKPTGALCVALDKASLEEVQYIQSALEADPRTSTRELRERYTAVQVQMTHLPAGKLDPAERNTTRRELQGELSQLGEKLAERVSLLAQTIRERNLTLAGIARSLPPQSALVDFIEYARYDFAAKTNQWKEQRYAAYLTFPLARDSTNVVVERVDLGEAAPINAAVELVCQRMSAGQFAAKDLPPALAGLSQWVYAPLAPYLTNVSHLIVCPDGQLSRLPFEMLSVGNKFLVEEKTISYVTSGREVVRLAKPLTRSRGGGTTLSTSDGARAGRGAHGKSLVMGNPDFDLDLNVAQASQPASSAGIPARSSELAAGSRPNPQTGMSALHSLSRDYRGLKFNPLPGSGIEATNVAKLLGADASLRLGADAREAELKTVVGPRVLHLATHGFFLSDQELNREIRGIRESPFGFSVGGPMADSFSRGSRGSRGSRFQDWENPLVRCGIALAGANYARQITNAVAEDGLLTGLEASLLNLQGTELVILSACDSGTGEVKIGEGVMSLRRAFRIAGAETVLASHWSVSDKATSRLITEFMRRWRSGEPRAKAWRGAQLSLLHSKGAKEDFSDPYFWAAFTLTGQWN